MTAARKLRANGEGSVYHRRSDGLWIAAVTLPSGRRRTRSAHTERAAVRALIQLRAELDAGVTAPPQNPTLRAWLTHWVDDVAALRVRHTTLAGYQYMAATVSDLIGQIRLHDLRTADIQHAYGRMAPTMAASSLRTRHAALRAALQHALREGLIARNPAIGAVLPKPDRRHMQALSAQQVAQLLASTEDQERRCLWTLLATTGLRIGEALALTWDDVDPEKQTASITTTLSYIRHQGFQLAEPKSARARRMVYLSHTAVEALHSRRHLQNLDKLAHRILWFEDLGDLIFTTATGRPHHTSDVEKKLKVDLATARLPQIRVHDLRHTAASIALAQGIQPKVVQELLGHASSTLTLDVYSHTVPAMHAQLAATFDELLSQERQPNETRAATSTATRTGRDRTHLA